MTIYRQALGGTSYHFDGLVELLAKASPARSGDLLAGCAASSERERERERVAARWPSPT